MGLYSLPRDATYPATAYTEILSAFMIDDSSNDDVDDNGTAKKLRIFADGTTSISFLNNAVDKVVDLEYGVQYFLKVAACNDVGFTYNSDGSYTNTEESLACH